MKKILITREKEEALKFAQKLRNTELEVIIFPVIKTKPIYFDSKIISKYDVFIFPSKNAVRYFFENVSAEDLKKKIIIAVGEKTKKALEKKGFKNILLPEKFSSEGVLSLILKDIDFFKNKKILIPRAKKGIDILPQKLKNEVKEIFVLPIYETVLNIPENKENVKKLFEEKKIDFSVFTSPSTIENFLKIFPEEGKEYLKSTCITVIGTTTKKAVEEKGLDVCLIPEKFTIDEVIKKIKEQLS